MLFMDFSPLKNRIGFLSQDGEAIPRESEAGFWCGFLNAQQAGFEEGVSAAVKDGRDRFHGGIKPHGLQREVRSQNEILGNSNRQRGGIRLGSYRYLQRAAGHSARRGLAISRFRGSRPA